MTDEQRTELGRSLDSWTTRGAITGNLAGLAYVWRMPGKHGFWIYLLGFLLGGAVGGLAGKAIDRVTGERSPQ